MAVACRCPRGQQRFSNTPLKHDQILSPTTVGHTWATPTDGVRVLSIIFILLHVALIAIAVAVLLYMF